MTSDEAMKASESIVKQPTSNLTLSCALRLYGLFHKNLQKTAPNFYYKDSLPSKIIGKELLI